MPLTLIQKLRRLAQKSNWDEQFEDLNGQLPLIKKLYANNGLEIKLTSEMCPEQYDVYKAGKQVAYYRLRHGEFRVDYPECGEETIYQAQPNGDGHFPKDERILYLTRAMRAVLKQLIPNR